MKSRSLYFECGDGWKKIISECLTKIAKDPVNVTIFQIKEKFGELRIYYNGGSEVTENAVKEAEELCSKTCEFCGEFGVRRDLPWIRVLCDKHYEEEIQRFKSCERPK